MALDSSYAETTELADAFRIGDSAEDDHLELALSAASRWVRSYCGKDFGLADSPTERTFHASDDGVVWIDEIGDPTGLVIATDTAGDGTYGTTWDAADYQLEPLNAAANSSPYTRVRAIGSKRYPYGLDRPAVQVSARWGWPSVPDDVKQATMVLAAALYKRRDSAEGVLGGFGDFGPLRVGSRLDPHVEMLLAPYRDIVLA